MDDQCAVARTIRAGTVAHQFAEQLRSLRMAAGNPSFRKMAGQSGRISHTTLHEAATGNRFPSWETTREFVRVCEGDETQWRHRWEEAHDQVLAAAGCTAPTTCATTTRTATTSTATTSTATTRTTTTHTATCAAITRAATTRETTATEHRAGRGWTRWSRLFWTIPRDAAGTRRLRLAALAAVVVTVVAVLAVLATTNLGPPSTGSLVPGDSSQFVADVTIPDGMQVKTNAHFVKVWSVANVGSVVWHNRVLTRMDANWDDDGCRTPERVPIGDTAPGERVMISVPVTAPEHPGTCWVGWKMLDEHGQPCFPSRRPVYFMVNVVD